MIGPRLLGLVVTGAIAVAALMHAPAFADLSDRGVVIEQGPMTRSLAVDSVVCRPGNTFFNAALFFQDPNAPSIAFYTLLNPAACAACSSGILDLKVARVAMRFRSLCPIRLRLSVVETNGDTLCPAPDTTRAIWPAFEVVIADSVRPGPVAYGIPFPGSHCLSRRAFLRVQILSAACTSLSPSFGVLTGDVTPGGCHPCRSYWEFPVSAGGGPVGDTCDALDAIWTQWVESECCSTTPTRPRSWGQIKLLYR